MATRMGGAGCRKHPDSQAAPDNPAETDKKARREMGL
jgi:hypothetical protein